MELSELIKKRRMDRLDEWSMDALAHKTKQLEVKIKEMSELCLTNGEVNKIKADAVRGAVTFFSPALDLDTEALIAYADKLEKGEL